MYWSSLPSDALMFAGLKFCSWITEFHAWARRLGVHGLSGAARSLPPWTQRQPIVRNCFARVAPVSCVSHHALRHAPICGQAGL